MNPQNQDPLHPSLLKVKTKDDEIKDLKHKAEKHDYENILLRLIMNTIKRNINL